MELTATSCDRSLKSMSHRNVVYTTQGFVYTNRTVFNPSHCVKEWQRNLTNMWGSIFKISAMQRRAVTEMASQLPFSCVNLCPFDAKAIWCSVSRAQPPPRWLEKECSFEFRRWALKFHYLNSFFKQKLMNATVFKSVDIIIRCNRSKERWRKAWLVSVNSLGYAWNWPFLC